MEKNTKFINPDQALEAEMYVKSYYKFMGHDYVDIGDEIPGFLPKDVKAAWQTVLDFREQADKEGVYY